jgi:hypothetical protein
LVEVFKDVRIAENASLGGIASLRVQIIDLLDNYINKRDPPPNEFVLQKLLEESPWLIYPTYNVLTSNEAFSTFRRNIEGWFKRKHDVEIVTSPDEALEGKRPDFIMIHTNKGIRMIDLKKPGKDIQDDDVERFTNYIDFMDSFFDSNEEIRKEFGGYQAVLICDGYNLSRSWQGTLDGFVAKNKLICRTWTEILNDTQAVHNDFLTSWKSQRKMGSVEVK